MSNSIKISTTNTNKILWIICLFLMIVGISLVIHAIIIFDTAEVIVEWTTASELNTVGFNLLRAKTSDGPFEQINAELIPASSDSLIGSNYNYEDSGVQSGVTYYYMLEEIEATGETNRHGPIVIKTSNPAQSELLIASLLIIGAIIYSILLVRDRKHEIASNKPHEPVIHS